MSSAPGLENHQASYSRVKIPGFNYVKTWEVAFAKAMQPRTNSTNTLEPDPKGYVFGIPPRRVIMPRKRRSFSATFKSKVALDAIKGLKTVAEIAKLHQVHPSQVVLWKRQLLEGVESVFDGPTDRKDKAADQPQTAELYEQIGKLNMQLEWIKKKVAENGL
jgi:putative transposase